MSDSVCLPAAVVDSSAIMSMFDRRPSGPAFADGLLRSNKLFMSAPTLMALSVVVIGNKAQAGLTPLDDLLARFKIEILAFDSSQVHVARRGCASYGRAHHRADLN